MPSGIPYLTTRGGRIIGHEALTLQGLGLDQLELNMLSQANLQDLAGNAMTSPVIGVAIAAALSIFYPKFRIEGKDSKPESKGSTLDISGGEILQEKVKLSSSHAITLSPGSAVEQARLTRRLCACEGRMHKRDTVFQRCTTCLHTTCKKCGVKPRHHYLDIPDEDIQKRKFPNFFEDLIKRSIPASISFKASSIEISGILQQISEQFAAKFGVDFELCATFQRALSSEVYLRNIRRDEYWEVKYDSPDAKLVLVISEKKVEWRLYANVEQDGLGTPRGEFFRRFPIARMQPNGDDINDGCWFIWVPEAPDSQREFAAELKWGGDLIKNFANQRGLPEMDTEYVYSTCELVIPEMDQRYFDRDVQGHYKLSQECGQPHNTLHARECRQNEQPLFFYLEQHLRTGNPDQLSKEHYFVFTEETHRLEKLDHRAIIANFGKTWRPPIVKVATKEYPFPDYRQFHHLRNHRDVQYIEKLEDAEPIYLQQGGTICVDGRWVSLTSLSVDTQGGTKLSYHVLPSNSSALLDLSDSCKSSASAILSLEAVLTCKISGLWVRQMWTEITRGNEANFLRDFGWALMQGCILDGHIQDVNSWHAVVPKQDRCFDCAPQSPPLQWSMNKKGKAFPCEEPLAATAYEGNMKSRPPAFTAKFQITNEGKLSLIVGINPQTLIHRALALLPCLSTTSVSWRLVTDDVTYPNASLKELTVKDNKNRIGRIDVALKEPMTLRPEQMRAVDWAIARDRGGAVFIEEEVVEARMSGFGYRLEGKAVRDVKPRGGLLFFDVGFGKTAITLALTQNRLQDDEQAAKELTENLRRQRELAKRKQVPKDKDPLKDKTPLKGKIPLKATIIFTPDHLPKQWAAEIEKFLGKPMDKVLVIEKMNDLKKMTVQKFQDADLIIVCWDFLENSSYHAALAEFAGVVDRDDTGSLRSKSEWYKRAASKVIDTVELLYEDEMDPKLVWEKLENKFAIDDVQSTGTKVPIPTKRQRGIVYIKNKDRKDSKEQEKGFKPYVQRKRTGNAFNFQKIQNIGQMKCPLFEIFSFARLVIDEFTYLLRDPISLLVIKNITAPSKFILSGTPSLASFADVKEMASILGVHLGIDDYSSMKTDAFKQATQDLSRKFFADIN